MATTLYSFRLNYKNITDDLLKYGKSDLPKWDKEEFVCTCMIDYGVCRKTALKVYEAYHSAIKNL